MLSHSHVHSHDQVRSNPTTYTTPMASGAAQGVPVTHGSRPHMHHRQARTGGEHEATQDTCNLLFGLARRFGPASRAAKAVRVVGVWRSGVHGGRRKSTRLDSI